MFVCRPQPVFKQTAYHTTSLEGQLGISSSLSVKASKRTNFNKFESAFVHSRDAPAVSFARISSEPPPLIAEFPQGVTPGSETATCLFPLDAIFPQISQESEIRTDEVGERKSQKSTNSTIETSTVAPDTQIAKHHTRFDSRTSSSFSREAPHDDASISVFLGALNMSGGPLHNTTVHAHLLVVPGSYLRDVGETPDEFALKHSLLPINVRRKNPILYFEGTMCCFRLFCLLYCTLESKFCVYSFNVLDCQYT